MIVWNLFASSLFFILSLAIGRRILRSNSLFDFFTGAAILLYAIWFLGIFGACGRWHLIIFYSLLAVLFSKDLIIMGLPQFRRSWGIFGLSCLVLAGLACLIQIIGAHASAVWNDDLSYHLYLPKAYLEMGRITPPPFDQRQSFYHQIFNMAYLPAMAWGGELAAKLINVGWAIAAACLVFTLSRRWLDIKASALAAAAFLTTPGLFILTRTAMTDLAAACFALAGLLAYLEFEEKNNFSYLFLSALFSGFALNKYTVWSFPLALILIFAVRQYRKPKVLFAGLAVYVLCAALCLSPLAFYLWKHTGNPLYPLPVGFGLPYDWIEGAAQKYLSGPKTIGGFLSYLWSHLLNGMWLEAGPLLLLAPLAFFIPLAGLGTLAAWSLTGFFLRYLWIGESAMLFRYILPAYAAWMILAASVWQSDLFKNIWARRAASAIVVLGLIFPGLVLGALRAIPEARLNLGLMDRDSYLGFFYPSEGWQMVNKINALPEGSKVAVLDHHFMPYHYRDLASSLWPVDAQTMALNDPSKIRAELARKKTTHVLLVAAQWNPLKTKKGYVLAAVFMGPYVTCRWWERNEKLSFLKPVYNSSGAVLYQVRQSK